MKILLYCLAALLFIVAPAWTVPGVGYHNVDLAPGLNAVAPPLWNEQLDTVGEQFADLPDGSIVFKIVEGSFTTNTLLNGVWERPDEPLSVGEGILVFNPLDHSTMVTFVGEVLQGALTNPVPAGLSLKGNMIPREGALTTTLEWRLNDFDNVYLLRNGEWDVYTQLPGGTWHPSEPILHVAEAFIVRASSPTTHVIHFSLDPEHGHALAVSEMRRQAAAASGTVNFANAAAGLQARVVSGPGHTPVQGSSWRAQLMQQSGEEFHTIAETPFLSGHMAGYFLGGRVDLPGSAPGESAVLKVRILRHGEPVAESEPLTVELGGEIFPPSNLAGLQEIHVIEPMRLFVQRDETHTIVSWSRESGAAHLEISDTLGGEWRPFEGTETSNEHFQIATQHVEKPATFYRLRFPE